MPFRSPARTPHPLSILLVSMVGQSASAAAVNGPAFLIPTLHAQGMSLSEAGWVAAAAIGGAVLSQFAWGALVDSIGERVVMGMSLLMTALSLTAAAASSGGPQWQFFTTLILCGVGSAGTAAASGRIVVGWFPAQQRGTAMGSRQMAQPLGVGLAGFATPVVASRYGVSAALLVLAAYAVVAAACCLALLIDPGRPDRHQRPDLATNPYREGGFLARIHLASMLLVVPQMTLWTFQLVWLQVDRGWTPTAAGALVAATQLAGGLGRIASGWISDRMGSRVRPLRAVALAAAVSMAVLGLSIDQPIAVPLIVLASVLTVADNGLAFTAVAERGGPFWSGRALGVQNTGQYLVGAAVPPALGALIAGFGFGAAFAGTALFPLLAVAVIPRRDRVWRDRGLPGRSMPPCPHGTGSGGDARSAGAPVPGQPT